jgi:hypothetical protein
MKTLAKISDTHSMKSILQLMIKYTQINNTRFIKIDKSNYKSFFGDYTPETAEYFLKDLNKRKLINLTVTSSSYILTVLEEAYKVEVDEEEELTDEISEIRKYIHEMAVLGNSLKVDDQYDDHIENIQELASGLINFLKLSNVEAEND